MSELANVYVGLAGETESYPGYTKRSGIYRSRGGVESWELLREGLPAHVEVRALAVHPSDSALLYAGTQVGVFRSRNEGDTWQLVGAPAPGYAVWSLAFHPDGVLLAGYEPAWLWRSFDEGDHWESVPLQLAFPEVTQWPRYLPKRVIDIALDPDHPEEMYVAVEVGGLLRTRDGGKSFAQVVPGPFENDDPLDIHSVTVTPGRSVHMTRRIGIARSDDGGDSWVDPTLEPPIERNVYSRTVRAVPGDGQTLFLACGGPFDDAETVLRWGALLRSLDGGRSWAPLDLGVTPRSTMFEVAIDARDPKRVFCAAFGGEVFRSDDCGESFTPHPLPGGAAQIYALAVG